MPDIVIHINPTGKKARLLNISETLTEMKTNLIDCNNFIKGLENKLMNIEIDNLFDNTDGDLYKDTEENKRCLEHAKLFKKTLSVNVIILSNIVNMKFHLIKNNLELVKKCRDEFAEKIFEDKEELEDEYYKHNLESLDRWYKELHAITKVVSSKSKRMYGI